MWWQKDVSTILGIMIVLFATVIIFSGVFAYQYLANQIVDNIIIIQPLEK